MTSVPKNKAKEFAKLRLQIFGDHLAQREGYNSAQLKGLEAIYFYLCHKFHWTPAQVRAMQWQDIQFLLTEEIDRWDEHQDFLPDLDKF